MPEPMYFTEQARIHICRDYSKGYSIKSIARLYGITTYQVKKIIKESNDAALLAFRSRVVS